MGSLFRKLALKKYTASPKVSTLIIFYIELNLRLAVVQCDIHTNESMLQMKTKVCDSKIITIVLCTVLAPVF